MSCEVVYGFMRCEMMSSETARATKGSDSCLGLPAGVRNRWADELHTRLRLFSLLWLVRAPTLVWASSRGLYRLTKASLAKLRMRSSTCLRAARPCTLLAIAFAIAPGESFVYVGGLLSCGRHAQINLPPTYYHEKRRTPELPPCSSCRRRPAKGSNLCETRKGQELRERVM
jgi:hypothetical protein